MPPVGEEIILVVELFARAEGEIGEFDLVWVVVKVEAADTRDAELSAVNEEAMEGGVAPAEGDLKNVVKTG